MLLAKSGVPQCEMVRGSKRKVQTEGRGGINVKFNFSCSWVPTHTPLVDNCRVSVLRSQDVRDEGNFETSPDTLGSCMKIHHRSFFAAYL